MLSGSVPTPARSLAAWVVLSTLAASVVSCRAPDASLREDGRSRQSPGEAAEDPPPPSRAVRHSFTGTAMGCVVAITIDDDDAGRARDAARAGLLELDRLDAMYSDWKRSSELSRVNDQQAPRVEVSREFAVLLARALAVSAATDGRFDPTVGTVVACWRESRTSGRLAEPATLEAARAKTGWRAVRVVDATTVERTAEGVRLDFGGIAKGEGAVRALAAIQSAGCPRALVAVAGDIACGDAPRGEAGWTVEIAREHAAHPSSGLTSRCEGEHEIQREAQQRGQRERAPASAASSAQRLRLSRRAMSTSGGSAQWVEIDGTRYAHIVDPRTGLGATRLAQATVIGPLDAAVDALGTALALTDDDAQAAAILARFPGYEAILERGGTVHHIPPRAE